jgi:branched-chain amino acid transport system permease protein
MQINWRETLRYGLLGGVATLYFSAIGIVVAFSERNLVGDFLSLGHLLLFGGAFTGAYLAARGKALTPSLLIGTVSGLLSSSLLSLLYLFTRVVTVRNVLVNVNNTLFEFITFGGGDAGLGIFIGVCAALGLIGAAYSNLPGRVLRSLTLGLAWLLGLALFSQLVTQVITNTTALISSMGIPLGAGLGRQISGFLFIGDSFQPVVAAVVLLGSIGLVYWREGRQPGEKAKGAKDVENQNPRRKYITWGLIALALILLPWMSGRFISQTLFTVGLYVLMGLGLNIVVGYAGLLDLGYVAFFAFGAYTMALMTTLTDLNASGGLVNFWFALPLAMLVAVVFGVALGFPVLRMRGDYLAIVTLGFGEIIRILALSDWLGQWMGGAQGVLKIPSPQIFNIVADEPQIMYYIVLAGSLLVWFVSIRLRDSRLGRQWMAMREDEDVAEAMGINLIATKLLAFGIGAGFSGLAGAIFAARLTTIFPHTFNLLISMNVLSLIIVGGLGSIPGVIVGAFVLVGLPELLREFEQYRLLLYGMLLIVMMLVKPEGFLPADVFKRELHQGEEENIGMAAD